MAQDFRELIVWQKAMDLACAVYQLTQGFPHAETYGLISQMRRASISVASNIAEGRGRLTEGEFRHFLGMAQGSLFELKTQALLAKRLHLHTQESFAEVQSCSDEVSRMLTAFLQALSAEPGAKS